MVILPTKSVPSNHRWNVSHKLCRSGWSCSFLGESKQAIMPPKYSPLNRQSSDELEIPLPLPAPAKNALVALYLHFKDSFESLSSCPRELYVNFFLKFCESYGYFSISQILVIYLHNEFGASDVRAGAVYGIWGAAITFWGLCVSWLNDNFGVRNSLMLGFTISLTSSLLLATATSITTIYFVLFFFMPIGTAMGIPMLTVGIKRYTNTTNRGFAFGLYYSIMNVAAFVAGPIVDMFNIGFKNGITIFGVTWSGNRLVILTTTCTYLSSLVVTFLYLREIRVAQEEEVEEQEPENDEIYTEGDSDMGDGDIEMSQTGHRSIRNSSHERGEATQATHNPINDDRLSPYSDYEDLNTSPSANSQINHRHVSLRSVPSSEMSTDTAITSDNSVSSRVTNNENVETYTPEQRSVTSIWYELLRSPTFWRFSVLTLFLINLNTIFRHLDATLPTYLVRCFGANYPKGAIYSINPFIIMWLTPVIAALTTKYPHFDMIKYGGYVAAASPFFLVMATQTWAVVLFVVLLSFGEAIWSPRVYDYTMTIAPEGREASFSALAAAPLFAAKVPVGLLSGYLVHTYLPEDGSRRDGQTMWLIIGLLTLSSPILITVFESCIREPTTIPRKNNSNSSSSTRSGTTMRVRSDSDISSSDTINMDSSRSPFHHSSGNVNANTNSSSNAYSDLPTSSNAYDEVELDEVTFDASEKAHTSHRV